MRQNNLNITLLLITFLYSCTVSEDCFTADSIKQVKSFKANDNTYFVYLRVSGFQEKVSFYELYKDTPVFDNCGKSDSPPTSTVHADLSEGSISKLQIDGIDLKIIYDKNQVNQLDFETIPIETKNR